MSESVFTPWTGRQEETRDQLSRNPVKRIAAALDEPTPAHGEVLSPLQYWAFFQDPVEAVSLGADGHSARGSFLPPADSRNRMRAGGRLKSHQSLRTGGGAGHISTTPRIEEKRGRSGVLLFITLRRDCRQDGQLALSKEYDIVYREPTPPRLGGTEALPEDDWHEALEPDPVLLFRYSAVTFNGHRIHYGWPYVTGVEDYPDLVVHGPLIAILALRTFCRTNPQIRSHRFVYCGLRPLICPKPFEVDGRLFAADKAEAWVGDGTGLAQRDDVGLD